MLSSLGWRRPDLERGQVALLIGAFALLIALFYAPLHWLAREWRTNAYYEHGPLVPLAAIAVMLIALAGRRLRPDGRLEWLSVSLIAFGVGLRVLGAVGGSDFIGALALIPTLAGVLGYVLGGAALRVIWFPVGYLIFMVPMPFIDDLGFYFQRVSAWATADILQKTGFPVEFWGAELTLPGQNFVVGIPCSGLYSIMTLTALGLLYAWLLQFPEKWRVVALIIAVPTIAMISNIFRLTSILVVAYHYGTEMAINYYHDFAGIVFWAISLAMMFLIGRTLEWRRTPAAA